MVSPRSRDNYHICGGAVQVALKGFTKRPQQTESEIYLRGSCRDDTNIYADNDSDMVIQLKNAWIRDLTRQSSYREEVYNHSCKPSECWWAKFRDNFRNAFTFQFGDNYIKEVKKCLMVLPSSGLLGVDVVHCLQYRKYVKFKSPEDELCLGEMTVGLQNLLDRGGRSIFWELGFRRQHGQVENS